MIQRAWPRSRHSVRRPLFPAFATLAAALLLPALLLPNVAAAAQRAVPDWTLNDVQGRPVSFHDELDRGPVLVSFWALWCGPCLKEQVHLAKLATEMRGRLTVLAVNVDSPRSVHKVAPWVAASGYEDLVVLLDTAGDVQRTMQVGGTMPMVMLYDAAGREVYRHTGYDAGDEIHLREEVLRLLGDAGNGAVVRGDEEAAAAGGGAGRLQVSNRLEYSYSTESEREIVENWLDAAYTRGRLTVGALLDARQPAEEGDRANDLRHRYVHYRGDGVEVRAGHFYGMFGRGMLFASREDRTLRIDTALDGLLVRANGEGWRAAAFTGAPRALALDIRALDVEVDPLAGGSLGATAMTWAGPQTPVRDGALLRDYAFSGRASLARGGASAYAEFASQRTWRFDGTGAWNDIWGHGFYAGAAGAAGPLSLSCEVMDYHRFAILDGADGRTTLNNPPSLTREHLYNLLNRNPYLRDANDERGWQAEASWTGPDGWGALLNSSRIENQNDVRHFREHYAQVQREDLGPLMLRAGLDLRDVYSKGLQRDETFTTLVGEAIWHATAVDSWSLKAEHQHVEDTGTVSGGLGEFDRRFFTLEYARAGRWTLSAMLETNNKYVAQREFLEGAGPYPAVQAVRTLADGSLLSLWAGKRLGGYVCAGGVCKYEPAFQGVELFATFRLDP